MSDGASPRSAALVGLAVARRLLSPSTTRPDLPPWISTPGTRGRPAAASRNNTAPASRLAFLVAQSHSYRLFVLPFPLSFGPPLVESLPPVSCHAPETIASALLLAHPPTCRIDHHLLVWSGSKPPSSTSCPLTSSSFATDGICVAAGLLVQSPSPPAVFRTIFILLFKLSWSECFL